MTVGQCLPTAACDLVTCDQVRNFMPSNMAGMIGGCSASCCKQGVCHNLTSDVALLQLPGPTPTFPQRPIEYPVFEEENSKASAPWITVEDNYGVNLFLMLLNDDSAYNWA